MHEVPTEDIQDNLKHLKISQTNISVLQNGAFSDKRVEVLILSSNKISTVEK